MGVTFQEFKFLEYINNSINFGNVLTIGRQELILNIKDKIRLNLLNTEFSNDKFIDNLLLKKFKAISVNSLDNSDFEGANIICDMNLPINSNKNKFDTIIDFGTTEHIFNAPQGLQNISDLSKNGGTIIHSLPSNNNCGHGFWQFSPELFFSLYSEKNGFKNTELFIFDTYNKYDFWKVDKQNLGERLELTSDVALYLLIKTTKIKEITSQIVQQSDYVYQWNEVNKRKINSKKNTSIIWKKFKDEIKSIFYENILPLKLSERLQGKKISKKNLYNKNIYLKKIKFYDYK